MLWLTNRYADVAELADAHGSGPCAARLVGSTPTVGTKFAGMAYRLCTSLPSWLEGFDPPYPLHWWDSRVAKGGRL